MYAVIESGGKQYRVEPGDVIEVELLGKTGEAGKHEPAKGDTFRFERILMVSGDSGLRMGEPLIDGAVVTASLVGEVRGPKIRVFKTKRRNTFRRTRGHRQHMHRLRIDDIKLP
ncbi:MAG: 50S ribosomal protein L21 [Acidobacteriota bacterium]|nr:50S ribosomal protein L21 [Acidobacteriota bacterium]